MEISEILRRCDHTCLAPTTAPKDIELVCEEALRFEVASVCVPSCYVGLAKSLLGGKIPVCTVVGFPNGNCLTASKVAETKGAIKQGADEIDMVINVGFLKAGNFKYVLDEINAVKRVCGKKILKVIVETGLLSEAEKLLACQIVSKSKADFIKTSTGVWGEGAKLEDIVLFKKHLSPKVQIKASGGIDSFEKAEKFLKLGASRIGASKLVGLAKDKN